MVSPEPQIWEADGYSLKQLMKHWSKCESEKVLQEGMVMHENAYYWDDVKPGTHVQFHQCHHETGDHVHHHHEEDQQKRIASPKTRYATLRIESKRKMAASKKELQKKVGISKQYGKIFQERQY